MILIDNAAMADPERVSTIPGARRSSTAMSLTSLSEYLPVLHGYADARRADRCSGKNQVLNDDSYGQVTGDRRSFDVLTCQR
jgi:hypothetical protein